VVLIISDNIPLKTQRKSGVRKGTRTGLSGIQAVVWQGWRDIKISQKVKQHEWWDLVGSTAQIQHQVLGQVWEFVLLWAVLESRAFTTLSSGCLSFSIT